MKSQILPWFSFFCLLCIFDFFVVVQVPRGLCNPDAWYQTCGSTFDCGTITRVGYPFRRNIYPEYCGYPGLELNCESSSVTTIDIMDLRYRVLEIHQNTQVMKIVREDLMGVTCPQDLVNTTLDYSLFDYANSYTNLTFLYGCPVSIKFPGISPISCGNSKYRNVYVLRGDRNPGSCNASVIVPVLPTSFGKSVDSMVLDQVLQEGFEVRWKVDSKACSECTGSMGRCGYDFSRNQTTCFCPDPPFVSSRCKTVVDAASPSSTPTPGNSNSGNQVPRAVGLSIAGAAVLGIGIGWLIFFCRQRRKRLAAPSAQTESKDLPTSASNKNLITTPSTAFAQSIPSYPSSKSDLGKGSTYFGVQVFTYAELEEATDNFNSSRELGDGGFGIVYYGKLHDGRIVAVKRLYENNFKRLEQFMNEVEILTRLQHKNLVKLYGCTSKRSRELLLVYEYIPNGTVADHLHGKRANSGLLSWPIRLNIAIQSAGALAYLHASDIIHRDVKTNNILLDNDFHVKVADFGLSRLFPNGVTHVSTAPQGTPGYVDPEYYQCYQLTEKSDIYSFGVVLIELISSLQAVDTNRHRHDINLSNMAVNKIQNHMLQELVDPTLGFETNTSMRRRITLVAELAFRCLQQESDMRPSMSEVLEVLKGIQNEELNPQKAEVLDILVDDMPLLKGDLPPLSPDSDQRGSSSTPNSSG